MGVMLESLVSWQEDDARGGLSVLCKVLGPLYVPYFKQISLSPTFLSLPVLNLCHIFEK